MCVGCEEPISRERLRAVPSATRCVPCQTKFDKRPKTTPHENPEILKPKKRPKRKARDLSSVTEIG
ncbi:TraR/DksA family transcriptional regulator [Candidatus Binatus sp.]|uniref:TraR/DksA family transcriptional regulator n=1 Tax=Candidatus Binatus sp. TaxID=2811406 RepID=UPI003BB0057F